MSTDCHPSPLIIAFYPPPLYHTRLCWVVATHLTTLTVPGIGCTARTSARARARTLPQYGGWGAIPTQAEEVYEGMATPTMRNTGLMPCMHITSPAVPHACMHAYYQPCSPPCMHACYSTNPAVPHAAVPHACMHAPAWFAP